jgi:hypothetical protein
MGRHFEIATKSEDLPNTFIQGFRAKGMECKWLSPAIYISTFIT